MVIGQVEAVEFPEGFHQNGFSGFAFMKRKKVYDYTQHQDGSDYVFEAIDDGSKGYMTGQGRGIKKGDHLLLKHNLTVTQYQVQEIDYYSSPSDMWTALLKKIS